MIDPKSPALEGSDLLTNDRGTCLKSRRPSRPVKRWARALVLTAVTMGVMAPMARAAGPGDDEDMDGRLIGYGTAKKVAIEKSSATPMYLLFFFLSIIGCIPLFKNAKRE